MIEFLGYNLAMGAVSALASIVGLVVIVYFLVRYLKNKGLIDEFEARTTTRAVMFFGVILFAILTWNSVTQSAKYTLPKKPPVIEKQVTPGAIKNLAPQKTNDERLEEFRDQVDSNRDLVPE